VHSAQVHSALYTVYSAQCTLYSAQCTVHGAQYTVHSTQCTVHSAQQKHSGPWPEFPQGLAGAPGSNNLKLCSRGPENFTALSNALSNELSNAQFVWTRKSLPGLGPRKIRVTFYPTRSQEQCAPWTVFPWER
jgi:hypothetical protein